MIKRGFPDGFTFVYILSNFFLVNALTKETQDDPYGVGSAYFQASLSTRR